MAADIGPHGSIANDAVLQAGERTIQFALAINKRPVSGFNLTTLKGHMRLLFMERDGTTSSADPTNPPTEPDSAQCPGIYHLELTVAEATHGAALLHIDDGTGNGFDFQYIHWVFYGGTGNTGGLHNRA